MSVIPQEVLSKLGDYQNQIWQTVSITTSESVGAALTMGSALTTTARPSDLSTELAGPMLIIQFSLTHFAENSTVVAIPNDTAIELGSLVRGTQLHEVDENLLGDLRPVAESIVQGLCLSLGNLRNEAVVATGLSVRYQNLSLPPNLQSSPEVVRTQIAISSDEISGTLTWICDSEVAHYVSGVTMVEEDGGAPFAQVGSNGFGTESAPTPNPSPFNAMEDQSGLELLMDIPLEISVELGRVRMMVREVLELGTGSIVEIDKAAGEPVDVLVNGRLVARGEVVVIEDNFGVRITEILSPHERVARLGDAA